MKRVLFALLFAVVSLVAVLLVRGLLSSSRQVVSEASPPVRVDADGVAERLAGALRIRTLSVPGGPEDEATFLELHDYLAVTWPVAHATLTREVVGGLSLLYAWQGTDPSLPPLLLLGHLDTVPVDPAAEASWTRPPFSGEVADGFVWGRGALDDKGQVVAQLEAVEALLVEGFRPRRTVLLAYGHDEEIGGRRGAGEIAALLEARGVRASLVLDEGMIIADGMVPGVAAPAALLGISEKGSIHVRISATGEPGHSSMPPRHTAVGRVSAAVAKLEASPMKAALDGPAAMLFDVLGPEMDFGKRLVFANRWLLGPLVVKTLEANHRTNALVRTTAAETRPTSSPRWPRRSSTSASTPATTSSRCSRTPARSSGTRTSVSRWTPTTSRASHRRSPTSMGPGIGSWSA